MYERVRRAWATIVGIEELRGTQLVVRPESPFAPAACAAFLRFEDTLTVTAHDDAIAALVRDALDGLDALAALDPEVLRPRLPPIADTLGPTSLFYLPTPITAHDSDVEVVDAAAIAALVHASTADDLDESGIRQVASSLSIARDPGGEVVAACGYEHWPAGIAHLLVLTAPAARGRGLAKLVGAHATARAEAEGLIPQWRARVPASQAVARAIGFAEVGAQLRLRFA